MTIWDIGEFLRLFKLEDRAPGAISFTSSSLELVNDVLSWSGQEIGVRLNGLGIPQGALITDAYIKFQAEGANSDAAALRISGKHTDNVALFASASENLSARPLTTAVITWALPGGTTSEAYAHGGGQQSADISATLQEIVAWPGWSPKNALALIITASDQASTAKADHWVPNASSLIHIECQPPGSLGAPVVFDVPARFDRAADWIADILAAGTPVGMTGSAEDSHPGDTVAYDVHDPRIAVGVKGNIEHSDCQQMN